MKLTDEQKEEFEKASRPLIELLSKPDFHPHIQVIVTSIEAEMVEGMATVRIKDKKRYPYNNGLI